MTATSNTQTKVIISIGDTADEAQVLQNHLRNAGHPIRVIHMDDMDLLPAALSEHQPYLVIASLTLGDEAAEEIVGMIGETRCPLLVVTDYFDADASLRAMQLGAREAVCAKSIDHFAAVALREIEFGQLLRQAAHAEQQLQESEQAHKALMDDSGDAIAYVAEGIVLEPNPAFCALLECEEEDLDSMLLMEFIEKSQRSAIKRKLNRCVAGKIDGLEEEIELVTAQQNTRSAEMIIKRITRDGETMLELLLRAQVEEVEIAEAATQSSGRIALWQKLPEFIGATSDSEKGESRGIAIMQVDDFADLESRLGFEEAEELVVTLETEISAALADSGTLYRLSNHEFVALVTSSAVAELEKIAEKAREFVEKLEIKTKSHEIHLTASIVMYPVTKTDHGQRVIDAIRESVRKLTGQGGNRYLFMGPKAEETTRLRDEQKRAGEIRQAVQSGRLSLVYQSIASLEGDETSMFDVLVRMTEADGKEALARDFLPVAERFSMMPMIDHWVVGHAITTIRENLEKGHKSHLFIKLSEATVAEPAPFIKWLSDRIKRPSDVSEYLIFSLQENVINDHVRSAKLLATQLSELNIRISIDHFGQHKHSHRLLDTLQVNFLKLAPDFTKTLNDKKTQDDLAELMDHARKKELKTIAAQVEDANAMAQLWQAGINLIQGNHIQEAEVVLSDSTAQI